MSDEEFETSTAGNGYEALKVIEAESPDLVLLDIWMPGIDGLETLEEIKKENPAIQVIMITGHGTIETAIKAIKLGAFDFIPKPETHGMEESKLFVKSAIAPILKAFIRRKELRSILKGKLGLAGLAIQKKIIGASGKVERIGAVSGRKRERSEIIGIGISTGGPNALAQMLPRLSKGLNVPVLIVQHMPPVFTQSLAKSLDSKCSLDVKEASDGEAIRINTALIAPGGKQMKIVAGADGKTRIIRITDDPPENSCKPSVDYLFRSMAEHYIGRATGVIMTGMGADGTTGLKLMKRNGATVIAQDEATSTVYGMTKEAVNAGVVDIICPLDKIAQEINETVK